MLKSEKQLNKREIMAFFEVDESDFKEVIAEQFEKNNIVILKFGSEFCDACRALGWELQNIDDEYENVSVLAIDCNDSPDLAEKYSVRRLPTMIIYKDENTILFRSEDVVLSQDIENIIE
jgi:thioredoxin 1